MIRVVYRFGIFGRYSVGISWYLPYRYRRKTRLVHFGIKKGAVPPFFLKRGAMAPFLRSSPFGKKGGRKGGKYTKKGGIDTPKYRKSNKSDTGKIPIPKKLPVPPRYNSRDMMLLLLRLQILHSWCMDNKYDVEIMKR
jgi:hypothetical protein